MSLSCSLWALFSFFLHLSVWFAARQRNMSRRIHGCRLFKVLFLPPSSSSRLCCNLTQLSDGGAEIFTNFSCAPYFFSWCWKNLQYWCIFEFSWWGLMSCPALNWLYYHWSPSPRQHIHWSQFSKCFFYLLTASWKTLNPSICHPQEIIQWIFNMSLADTQIKQENKFRSHSFRKVKKTGRINDKYIRMTRPLASTSFIFQILLNELENLNPSTKNRQTNKQKEKKNKTYCWIMS